MNEKEILLKTLVAKRACCALNYFKAAPKTYTWYLQGLNLDEFKTCVVRSDGKIVLYKLPLKDLHIGIGVISGSDDLFLAQNVHWIYAGGHISKILNKKDFINKEVHYRNFAFELN